MAESPHNLGLASRSFLTFWMRLLLRGTWLAYAPSAFLDSSWIFI